MPTTPNELQARLALVTPQDTLRGMFFRGLLDAVRAEAGPEAEADCRSKMPPARRVDYLSYPLRDWLPALYRAAELLTPRLGEAGAFRRLGRQAVDDFFQSAAGKTLLVMAKGHPRTLMKTSPTSYLAAISWGKRRVEFAGPGRCVYLFERELVPGVFHEGVVGTSLEAVGARDAKVRSIQSDLTTVRLDIEWVE